MRFFYLIKRNIRFFFQRLFRGWDDSETWSMDITFYKWLEPRLKRFQELNFAYPCYPNKYPTFESWDEELKERWGQLVLINSINEFDFDDWSYIPKDKLAEFEKKEYSKSTINSMAYSYCLQDFNKWFAENVNNLWW